MNKIDIGYLTLEEVSELWGTPVQKILEYGANGILKIWYGSDYRKDKTTLRPYGSSYVKETPPVDCEYLENLFTCVSRKVEPERNFIITNPDGSEEVEPERDFIITNTELRRFEREHNFKNHIEEGALLDMPEESLYFSSELHIANLCWKELYGDNEEVTPKRGHKHMITEWLAVYQEEQSPPGKLSNKALVRIATVVNPNPKGGAPVIE